MITIQNKGNLDSVLSKAAKVLAVPQGYAGFCFQPNEFPDQSRTVLTTTGVAPCHCLIIVENQSDSTVLCHLDENYTAQAYANTTRLLEILRDGSGVNNPYFSVSIATSSPCPDTNLRASNVLRAVSDFCGGGTSGKLDAPTSQSVVAKTDHAFFVGEKDQTHYVGGIDQDRWYDKSSGVPGWSTWQRIGGMSPGFSGRRIRHLLNLDIAPRSFIKPT
ncbi:hypothetical protein GCE9029_00733 [Grimontia celer]|uniref:Uncharacterized protein n=1 Tax=Grimontia celer TaxID=1796497 RepID=A0A128EW83_9GAMM|nr:hypothetical protein [Grimontia celer]CZF78266.1 hypothetical protein GCE9029_00733 [Grimontia celer]